VSTQRVIINQANCYHAPPKKVLDVGLVGDMVFLAICDNEEVGHDKITTTIVEEIMVDVETLYEALRLLHAHQNREAKRRPSIEEKNCCRDEVPKKRRVKRATPEGGE